MNAVVRGADVDFDVARLDDYLKDWLGGAVATQVRRTEGGMSNPTYFVRRGDWRGGAAQAAEQRADALRPRDRSRISRSHGAARNAPCRRRSRCATAPTARCSARRSI